MTVHHEHERERFIFEIGGILRHIGVSYDTTWDLLSQTTPIRGKLDGISIFCRMTVIGCVSRHIGVSDDK